MKNKLFTVFSFMESVYLFLTLNINPAQEHSFDGGGEIKQNYSLQKHNRNKYKDQKTKLTYKFSSLLIVMPTRIIHGF